MSRSFKQKSYNKIIYSWDIENSVIEIDGQKYPHIYLMNISSIDITDASFKILESKFFRTLEDFRKFLDNLDTLSHAHHYTTLIYIHNLNYDLNFLIKKFKLNSESAIFSSRGKIISLTFKEFPNLQFRDNLALFPKKLEKIGKEIGIKKLDYKYNEIRLCTDTLTEYDYLYNQNDNVIVLKNLHIFYHKKNYKGVREIPYTSTGIVRQRDRKKLKSNNIKIPQGQKTGDEDIEKMQIVIDDFKGGFSGSTIYSYGKDFDIFKLSQKYKCKMYGIHLDINSEYSSIMTLEPFAYYTKKAKFEEVVNTKNPWICTFIIYNLKIKNIMYPPMFNISHARDIDYPTVYNGKVFSIKRCILTLNNEEFKYFKMIYDFEFIPTICYTGVYKYLNIDYIKTCIVDDYKKKQILKEKLKHKDNYTSEEEYLEDDYLYNKEIKPSLNGKYGQSVMSLLIAEYKIIKGISIVDRKAILTEESLESDNKRHVSFEQGSQIAIKGRLQIIDAMMYLLKKYEDSNHIIVIVQYDTDSLFLISDIEPYKIQEELNNRIERKYKQSKDVINKYCNWSNNDMLLYSLEKSFIFLRTYGAKKFIEVYEDNTIKTTVAGLSKERARTAIYNHAKKLNRKNIIESVKEVFQDNTQFDFSASGRTCVKNVDFQKIEYNGQIIEVGGSLIEEVTYKLSKKKQTKAKEKNFIKQTINIQGELTK